MHLHRHGETIGFVERYNGHCLFEKNFIHTQDGEQAAICTPTKPAEGVKVQDN